MVGVFEEKGGQRGTNNGQDKGKEVAILLATKCIAMQIRAVNNPLDVADLGTEAGLVW